MPETPDPSSGSDAGWDALREGRWQAARTNFEEAVAAHPTPEAYEGLSWSAWWTDDSDAVFAARERAFALHKAAGDAEGAARMAIWLALDQLDFRGSAAVAQGWLRRAHRLLEDLEPGPAHGWLAFLDGYVAHGAGELTESRELGRAAAELGRRCGEPDLEMLGLALEGAGLVAEAQVPEGMRCLDEATAIAIQDEARIPISGAWACCFLVTACGAVRDYERASEWCDRIAVFADRYGSRYMLAFCRAEYGGIHLVRGDWSRAETMLEASIADFAGSRPAMVGGSLVALAELRRRQGRAQDAGALLERAGPHPQAQLCRARIALDAGHTARAADLAERFLRHAPPHGILDRAPAFEILARARTARGQLDDAEHAVATLREIAGSAGTSSMRGCSDLAAGRLAAARGDHERARALLEDAVDRFEQSAGPFEAAEARADLAMSLLALGRPDAARQEAAVALRMLLELGANDAAESVRRLLDGSFRAPEPDQPLAELTPREREVVELVAHGLTNREIAAQLVVSEHTVHRHVTNILRKLELPSRTAVAALAVRSGLVTEARP